MDRERVLDDQTVIIQDGKIAAIGPSNSVKLPATTRKIDATGKYLIPGLTDAHVHLYSTIEFPLYLANGVTTVFNLDGRSAHLLWRKQVANDEMLGPRIFTTGPIFDRPHKPDEAVRIVDEQADAGYDAVKIFNQTSQAEFPALIAEAKRRHLLLMGHISRAAGFELTIQSGQSLAHLDEILYTYFNPQHDNNDHVVLDESKISTVAKETADAGVYVIPTLHTYATTVQQTTDLDAFLKNPDLRYLPPWAREEFQSPLNHFKAASSPEQSMRMQSALAFQRKLVKALFEDGVPLLAGSDAPDVGPMAGSGLHEELQELVRDGLSPFQVLRTATVNPALYFGRSQEFGTLEAGKRADLVLLARNPLSDIANTRAIVGVMVRGKWMSKTDLAQRVEAMPGAYQNELQQVESAMASHRPAEAERYLDDHDPLRTLGTAVTMDLLRTQSPPKFHQMILQARAAAPKWRLVSEAGINALGYRLLAQKRFHEALSVLRMNTEDFPGSPNTFDSLAEALFKSGNMPEARAAYAQALSLDPHYANADFAQKFVAEHALE